MIGAFRLALGLAALAGLAGCLDFDGLLARYNADGGGVDAAAPTGCVTAIAIGERNGCAVKADGTVWCWGLNNDGQLARDPVTVVSGTPLQIPIDDVKAVSVNTHTFSSQFACALKNDGTVWCWGGSQVVLGRAASDPADLFVPRPVTLPTGARSIASGIEHTCAVTDSNRIFCWGRNTWGQIGDGTANPAPVPTPVIHPALDGETREVSVGWGSNCALTTDGRVFCWGWNDSGQLGQAKADVWTCSSPAVSCSPIPLFVDLSELGKVASTATGASSACAVSETGIVACWGRNGYGELGVDPGITPACPPPGADYPCRQTPAVVPSWDGATNARSALLVAAGSANCALARTGALSCWGSNYHGQLGGASASATSVVPIPVVIDIDRTPIPAVSRVAFGNNDACAISGGEPWCWGSNQFSQLGLSGVAETGLATRVPGICP